ncbi:MAG TPA: hypothetical protein PKH10_06620 [bacterium]|nr:hypothetical protein [bacterium]
MHPARWVILFGLMLFFAAACDEDGLAGKNSLVKLSEEPAGGACPQGGTKVESGLDLDGDGELDLDEVRNVQYFCRDAGCTITDNGDGTKTIACDGDSSVTVKDGADGAGCAMTDNEDGTYTITCDGVSVIVSDASGDGAHKTLIVLEEAPGDTCPNGGQKVTVGIDRDDDGTLDTDEVTSTRYLCNGADGHDSLTTIDPLTPGEDCPAGGHLIRNGVDTDDDGTLDAGEVVSEVAVCNGADGNGAMTEVSPLDPGEGGCAAGGYLFRTGVDANGNGALDTGEYDEVAVCHGEKGDPGEDGVCAGNHPPLIDAYDDRRVVAVCHGEKGDPGEDGVCAGNHPPVIVSIDVP